MMAKGQKFAFDPYFDFFQKLVLFEEDKSQK
jgi:hypothetical protein